MAERIREVDGVILDPPLRYYCTDPNRSLAEVAKHFQGKRKGCSIASLMRRSAREGWPEIRRKYLSQLAEQLAEKAAAFRAEASAEPPSSDSSPDSKRERSDSATAGREAGASEPPRKPKDSLLARTAALTIERLAEAQAESHLPAFQSLEATWQQCAGAAQLLSARAVLIISSHKFETYPSGEIDPATGEEGRVVRDAELKPLDPGKLVTAGTLLQIAQNIALKAVTGNPAEALKQAQAALRKTEADVAFIEARVAGTLPPEKVEHMAPDSEEFTEFLRSRLGGQDRLGVLYGGPKQHAAPAEPEPDPHAEPGPAN